ncbi:MAG: multidrug ABC transporter ATP-binding protein [Cytophagaceae bacterium SCN 52-12]|nr:MAG: multidrug ABC transporter ATP-binding protein [Cytophagaceae bacterium SCN 52-12]
MSIAVTNLTKEYGSQKAVDSINFEVKTGEIVGFLGPNGAGKSTTMKILTGYVKATSGHVAVGGFDVSLQAMEARSSIGYLPEHNPLYPDMYVIEFLQFVGRLYHLKGRLLKERIAEMLHLCGLEREQHKKIGQLSKGYRQRVGLAQAFIHQPPVLILDEPTTGLDPNQLAEIRELIRTLGKDRTVLFSTHIMQEVEALCDRVVIVNRGKIVADDILQHLKGNSDSLEAVFRKLTT